MPDNKNGGVPDNFRLGRSIVLVVEVPDWLCDERTASESPKPSSKVEDELGEFDQRA